jgi:hypothetical protein
MERELMYKMIVIIIIIIVCFIIFFNQIDRLTGGLLKGFVASILFWIPFGSIYTSLTQGMAAIPG